MVDVGDGDFFLLSFLFILLYHFPTLVYVYLAWDGVGSAVSISNKTFFYSPTDKKKKRYIEG